MTPVEVEVTFLSAKDLKNVNWRHGDLKPYAVVWIHPDAKSSTRVAEDGDTWPIWDDTLEIPFREPSIGRDTVLHVDIVHVGTADDTKPLIGSARIPLKDIVDEFGFGGMCFRTVKLKLERPSGRPQGKLELDIVVREPGYYAPPPASFYPSTYGKSYTRDYNAHPPPAPYGYGAQPPAGYPYYLEPYSTQSAYGQSSAYGQPPVYGRQSAYRQPPAYGQQSAYGQPRAYGQQSAYGRPSAYGEVYGQQKGKKASGKYGMGMGLAVGAVAGVLGGLTLAEGVDYVEGKIADDVEERVEDDQGYDDDDF